MVLKFFIFLVLSSLALLVGCSSEPELDATNADSLSTSWQEMYETVPEAERETFMKGSAFIIIDAASPTVLEHYDTDQWSGITTMEYVTKPDLRKEARINVIAAFEGKTKADILAATENIDGLEEFRPVDYERLVDSSIL